MTIYEEVCALAEGQEEAIRAMRRDLHRYPELGWFEIRTTSIIADRLTKLGYEVLTGRDVCKADSRMGVPSQQKLDAEYARAIAQGAIQPYADRAKDGFTGAIGILHCGEGPVIAMRFDIDALPVVEENGNSHRPTAEGFRSVNEGVMHACGHDGHISMGLAVAEILAKLKDRLHGTVKLVFQPAEEGVRGAKSIADSGILDDVDYILGNHMGNGKDGIITGSAGTTMATTKLDCIFHGTAAHAGLTPEKGANAMLAAATAVLNIHAMPRHSGGDSRVNVGTLHAGTGRNVVCDIATLEIEVRGASTEVNDYLVDYTRRIVCGAAEMHGCTCEVKLVGAAESLYSDMDLLLRTLDVAEKKMGLAVLPPRASVGASEDMAYLVNRVRACGGKGVYFNTLSACAGPFHSKGFDFLEEDVILGVKTFCGVTLDLMGIA